MRSITLSFEVHQPHRLRTDGVHEEADTLFGRYFDDAANEHFFNDVAENCYYPATERLLEAATDLQDRDRGLKLNLSISTSWLEQARQYQPELLDLIRRFPDGTIDFVGQAHYHSLAGLFHDKDEFRWQLNRHSELIEDAFGTRPEVVTNTELIYHNAIGRIAAEEGYSGVFTEGVPRILEWRSPNHAYTQPEFAADTRNTILLRNRRLTDDVGYRFSAEWWSEYPLTAGKYASWLDAAEGDVINLFMDYETFGEHHWAGTGILSFLEDLPYKVLDQDQLQFRTAREAAAELEPVGAFDVFEFDTISWADQEMDASAWLGNPVQQLIFETLQGLEDDVKQLGEPYLEVWRKLLTSDHLHHIATKTYDDHSVHNYFSYFDHPHQGFAVIMEHLMDFRRQVDAGLRS